MIPPVPLTVSASFVPPDFISAKHQDSEDTEIPFSEWVRTANRQIGRATKLRGQRDIRRGFLITEDTALPASLEFQLVLPAENERGCGKPIEGSRPPSCNTSTFVSSNWIAWSGTRNTVRLAGPPGLAIKASPLSQARTGPARDAKDSRMPDEATQALAVEVCSGTTPVLRAFQNQRSFRPAAWDQEFETNRCTVAVGFPRGLVHGECRTSSECRTMAPIFRGSDTLWFPASHRLQCEQPGPTSAKKS